MPPRPMSSPTSYRPAKTRGNSSATYRPFTHYRTTTIYHDWPSAVLQPSQPRGQHKGNDERCRTRFPGRPAPERTAGDPRDRGTRVVRGRFGFTGFLAAVVAGVGGEFRAVDPPDGLPVHSRCRFRDGGGRAYRHVRLDLHWAGRLQRARGTFRGLVLGLGGVPGAHLGLRGARGAGCLGCAVSGRTRFRGRVLLRAIRCGRGLRLPCPRCALLPRPRGLPAGALIRARGGRASTAVGTRRRRVEVGEEFLDDPRERRRRT